MNSFWHCSIRMTPQPSCPSQASPEPPLPSLDGSPQPSLSSSISTPTPPTPVPARCPLRPRGLHHCAYPLAACRPCPRESRCGLPHASLVKPRLPVHGPVRPRRHGRRQRCSPLPALRQRRCGCPGRPRLPFILRSAGNAVMPASHCSSFLEFYFLCPSCALPFRCSIQCQNKEKRAAHAYPTSLMSIPCCMQARSGYMDLV